MIMPGHKYEYYHSDDQVLKTFLYEFFAGPTWKTNWGNWHASLSFWYYYLGFPYRPTNGYHSNHNLAVIPHITYKWQRFALASRIFTYHTLYSQYYQSPSERLGYSLMLTHTLEISYRIWQNIFIMLADEIFYGLLEDKQATATHGPGFYAKGFSKNKLYLGLKFFVEPVFVKLNYIYETQHSDLNTIMRKDHYMYAAVIYHLF